MDVKLYDSFVDYLTTEGKKLPETFTSSKSNFKREAKKYCLEDGILFRTSKNRGIHKKVLKKSDLELVWSQFHDHDLHAGTSTCSFFLHFLTIILFCCLSGVNKTYKKIHQRYYFWGLQEWVRNRAKECPLCDELTTVSIRAKRTPLIAIPVTPKIFWRVHIDLAGPFRESKSGCKYVALAICSFIKYPEIEGTFFLLIKQTKTSFAFVCFLCC